MVTSSAQCEKIQARRVKAGKRGYAKAVRRYLLDYYKHRPKPDFYLGDIGSLPHQF